MSRISSMVAKFSWLIIGPCEFQIASAMQTSAMVIHATGDAAAEILPKGQESAPASNQALVKCGLNLQISYTTCIRTRSVNF